MKYKFHVGQVVFQGEYFVKITNKYKDDFGDKIYTVAWGTDLNYDEIGESDLRGLFKREKE